MDKAEHKRIEEMKLAWRKYKRDHAHLCRTCSLTFPACGAKPTLVADLIKSPEFKPFVEAIPHRNYERVIKCDKYAKNDGSTTAPSPRRGRPKKAL